MEYKRVPIKRNALYVGKMPHSEVCMHMQVAGKEMAFVVVGDRAVQLYERRSYGISPATNHAIVKWVPFSVPVLLGEAGIYEDEQGMYAYDVEERPFGIVPGS